MPLLHELERRRHVVGHAQPRHDDAEAPAGEAGDADLALHVAELEGRGEEAQVVEFGEEEGLVFEADGVGGGEGGEGVGELAEGAADSWGGEMGGLVRGRDVRLYFV